VDIDHTAAKSARRVGRALTRAGGRCVLSATTASIRAKIEGVFNPAGCNTWQEGVSLDPPPATAEHLTRFGSRPVSRTPGARGLETSAACDERLALVGPREC
jgi:hypothetical protein